MDRPTRTLVVVGDHKTLERISNEMRNRNDVREVYNHQKVSNAVVIIIYDIRKSEAIYKELKASNILVFYTISKYEIPQEIDKCDESKNQGTIYITIRNGKNLNDKEFMRYLSGFGEIKEVKLSTGLIKCVEFYDTRCSRRAREALNNKTYNGCAVSIRNVWDLNNKARTELFNRIENEIHKFELPDVKDKRKKVAAQNKSNQLPFMNLFDEFIVENLDSIAKNII